MLDPENISQNAYMQVGDEVYLVHSSARLSGSKTLVGEARDEAKSSSSRIYSSTTTTRENYGVKGQLSISSEYLEDFAKTYYTVYEFCRICASQSKEERRNQETWHYCYNRLNQSSSTKKFDRRLMIQLISNIWLYMMQFIVQEKILRSYSVY